VSNRLTVCVSSRHREFILAGVQRYRLNTSEYVRRLLDIVMDEVERNHGHLPQVPR
jgi:hypothetical protein